MALKYLLSANELFHSVHYISNITVAYEKCMKDRLGYLQPLRMTTGRCDVVSLCRNRILSHTPKKAY